jgi:hypothetical protein
MPGVPTPNAAGLLARLGMTPEQVAKMNKRRVGQTHAARVLAQAIRASGRCGLS